MKEMQKYLIIVKYFANRGDWYFCIPEKVCSPKLHLGEHFLYYILIYNHIE